MQFDFEYDLEEIPDEDTFKPIPKIEKATSEVG